MTATLVAKNLAAGHGDRSLFSGLDLVVAPGDVIGLVGANGAGKSTLLTLLAGLTAPEQGELRLSPPTATVGHLPQEPERRPGETVREFLARRTGVAEAQRAMDAATQALVDAAPGADDAYATSLERWLALGGADLDERAEEVAASLGLGRRPRPADDLAVRRPGRARGPRLPAAVPLRRLPARRADQRPRPRRPGAAGALRHRPARRHGRRQPRPRVPHPHGHQGPRTRPRPAADQPLRRRLRGLPGGARDVARRHAREDYEEYADKQSALQDRARTQRAWMDKGVKNARRKAANDNDKIGRKFRGEASEKQAAKARQTERMIERLEVVEEPRKEWELRMEIAGRPALGRGRRHPARRRGAARRLHASGRSTLQIDWADRVAITGANGAGKSTLLGALLGRIPLDAGHAAARLRRRGRRGRPGARAVPRGRAAAGRVRRGGPRHGARRGPHPAGQVRAEGGPRPAPGRHPVPRASAPAPPSRCSRPGASTCWSSTSRPTTSTCRRSSSWSRRSTPTRARCCWSPTTGGCSTRSHVTRRLEVADGHACTER